MIFVRSSNVVGNRRQNLNRDGGGVAWCSDSVSRTPAASLGEIYLLMLDQPTDTILFHLSFFENVDLLAFLLVAPWVARALSLKIHEHGRRHEFNQMRC